MLEVYYLSAASRRKLYAFRLVYQSKCTVAE